MCGIGGIVGNLSTLNPSPSIKGMMDSIWHRGPDDAGYFTEGPVMLGHRRLSILDLSLAGHQPMHSHDNSLTLVYNGEIYNYLELRSELEKLGCQFRSGTDTEVILEAYRIWGTECVTRFNGMWAFALYDKKNKSIFLSRDRFGIKPFYYLHRHDLFAFCSEIKGILSQFQEERIVNYSFLYYFLPSGALDDGPETFYKNIYSLLPAHNGLYDINTGKIKFWRYWDLDVGLFQERWQTKNPEEMMWELMNSAVSLCLRSDVPVGSCLSGGVDSSTIVGIMRKLSSAPIYTYSGLYADKDCDERVYVDAVNNHVGAVPGHVFPDPKDELVEVLNKIGWHQDGPTAGPGLITQYYVMQRAAKDVKVLLDGQGGDELLAGYLPYFGMRIQDLLQNSSLTDKIRAASLVMSVMRHWGKQWLPPLVNPTLKGRAERLLAKISFARKNGAQLAEVEPSFFHPNFVKQCEDNLIIRLRPRRMDKILGNTLYWHLAEQSIPALLHYEDRNSMAFSIEARVPILDYRIVEFALSLDDRYKINGSWTKWVLRKSAARVLPPAVAWHRSKLGYPTPFARWLREEPNKTHFRDLLFSDKLFAREIVTKESLDFYWNRHQSGKADYSWLLYRYASMELWFQNTIDDWKPAPITSINSRNGVTRQLEAV